MVGSHADHNNTICDNYVASTMCAELDYTHGTCCSYCLPYAESSSYQNLSDAFLVITHGDSLLTIWIA